MLKVKRAREWNPDAEPISPCRGFSFDVNPTKKLRQFGESTESMKSMESPQRTSLSEYSPFNQNPQTTESPLEDIIHRKKLKPKSNELFTYEQVFYNFYLLVISISWVLYISQDGFSITVFCPNTLDIL